MPSPNATRLTRALLIAAVLALGACGRRGPLEPPPDPTTVQKPAAEGDLPITRPKVAPITPPTNALPIDKLL